jgi:hypothetical protein
MEGVAMRTYTRWALVSLVLAGLLVGAAGPAFANGAPQTIYLSYLPGVSNWGPQNAKGTAVVAVGEGSVNLEVHGLPKLDNAHYQVWLESRIGRKLYSAGTFNVGDDGVGTLKVLLDNLPYQEYRMLFISVEPDPDPSPDPDTQRSIAGLFPNPAAVQPGTTVTGTQASGTGTGTGTGTGVASAGNSAPPPSHLPTTGADGVPQMPALISGFCMVACAVVLRLNRRR